ncbi:MAG: winged helix-turn-helix transcriptional regulator [Elusimicrobia bacterium]|nr:winged helix-turn-helix transcriptional regulator [Elusimicrobiota bacterium]
MPSQNLAEKEFLLIQEISRQPMRTQRDLSQSLGLSLGMTNLLIKRLSRKGLIKISQLDWKRTQYLLTLQGALEKTKKSYDYTLYTIRLFRQIEANIASVLAREHKNGRRSFHLVAQDELKELLSEKIAELAPKGAEFAFYRTFADIPESADHVLTATLEAPPPGFAASRCTSIVDFNNISFRL